MNYEQKKLQLKRLKRTHKKQLDDLHKQQTKEMYELKVDNLEEQIRRQGFVYVVVMSDIPDGNDSPNGMLVPDKLVPDKQSAKIERMNEIYKYDNYVKIVKRDIIKEPLSDAEMSQLRDYVIDCCNF